MNESLTWPHVLGVLTERKDLSVSQAAWAMERIVHGEVTQAQLAGFLIGLRVKGETVDELIGLRDAALEHARPLSVDGTVLDIVGTGGDQLGTVNVSTMASIVAAASGVPVVKFGNRGVSSRSGSSDVLAALGIRMDLEPGKVARVLEEVGITFAFAGFFHPGFRNARDVRSELVVPTVFNILGPLCNPARPEASAVGVARLDRIPLVVGVFQERDATAIVFRGDDGLDELTTTGHSHVWEVSRGLVREHDLDPRDVGIPLATIEDLRGGDARHNVGIVHSVMAGESGAVRDIVLLNAAAGLVAHDLARDADLVQKSFVERLRAKLALAIGAIDSGAAGTLLERWVAATTRP